MWSSYAAMAAVIATFVAYVTWWAVAAAAQVRRPGSAARAPATVTMANLLVGALVAGFGALVLAAVSVLAGFSGFFAFHVLWFAAVLGLPLCGCALLVAARRVRPDERTDDAREVRILPPPTALSRPARVAVVATLALAAIGVYGSVVEPDRLDVEQVAVPLASARAGSEAVRVGVISDIQTREVGAHEIRAVDTLMAQHPDIVLITGDVYQGPAYEAHEDELRAMLARLAAPGGVFIVQGDTDEPATLARMVEGTGVVYLRNEVVQVEVRDREITIGGVELVYDSPGAQAVARELELAPGDDDIRILTAHRPDVVYQVPADGRVDLVTAGHTHGGQISIPWYGPILTMSGVPRAAGGGGLHELEGRTLYVSKGVGVERNQAPQVRLNVVPNIGIVELR